MHSGFGFAGALRGSPRQHLACRGLHKLPAGLERELIQPLQHPRRRILDGRE